MSDEIFLQTADAAEAPGVTPSSIWRAIHEGRLPVTATTRRGTNLFRVEDVELFRQARVDRLARRSSSRARGTRPRSERVAPRR